MNTQIKSNMKTLKHKVKPTISRINFWAISFVLFLVSLPWDVLAQAGDRTARVQSALNTVRTTITPWVDGIAALIYVVCGIIAVVNGVSLYQQVKANEANAKDKILSYFGAPVVVVIAVFFIRAILIN